MIKVIFFDFDGTISDARKIAFESLVRTLDDYGYKFSRDKLLGLMGNKMQIILKGLGLKTKDLEIVREKFYKYFTKAALDGGISPCVSIKPLWKLLEEYPLIAVSNSETSFLRASIKKLKLKGLFREVHGAEKFVSKDEMLRRLFKRMKIKPSEAIYVGDRFSDVRFAKKAGCFSVAVQNRCSWSSFALVKKEKPDFIIRDFRSLRRVLREIDGKSF
ncbi:MAG: HAD family hydrolase [Nanoarchaeota archaeon]|nr:HAD family hydrolase [Nanoarchaeota archaeon]